VNDWLIAWGIEGWKPALRLLLMPPVPMLLLGLLGLALIGRRLRLGRLLVGVALLATWVVATPMSGYWLPQLLTQPPPVLAPQAVAALAASAKAPRTAILVLGGGRKSMALEYDTADLSDLGAERLRYGAWLARKTQLPLAFSGGVAHASDPGPTEAALARAALQRDFGLPLRWAEERSRDTNENAIHSVAQLQAAGITQIVLVTHDFHQRRALAAFGRAIARSGRPMALVAAPMGARPPPEGKLGDFIPDARGLQRSNWALHEWLGRLAGA
jgi:uncharacterized SAM-binding protein YcdF (DUF218 family)